MPKATIGSVSHGTLRPDRVAVALLDELTRLDPDRALELDEELEERTRASADGVMGSLDEGDLEEAEYLVDELIDALSVVAPPFCYFGTHGGDGSDFGFWPDWDSMHEAERDGDLVVIDDGQRDPQPEPPTDGRPYLHVSDHGNPTLYVAEFTYRPAWETV